MFFLLLNTHAGGFQAHSWLVLGYVVCLDLKVDRMIRQKATRDRQNAIFRLFVTLSKSRICVN